MLSDACPIGKTTFSCVLIREIGAGRSVARDSFGFAALTRVRHNCRFA